MGRCARCGREYPESGFLYCYSCIASNPDLRAKYEGIGIKLDWEELAQVGEAVSRLPPEQRRAHHARDEKGPPQKSGDRFLLVGILIGIALIGFGIFLDYVGFSYPGLWTSTYSWVDFIVMLLFFPEVVGIVIICFVIYEFAKEKIKERRKIRSEG